MNDSPESSSSAAQGAQEADDSSDQRPGLLARLFGNAQPPENTEPNGHPSHPAGSAAHAAISIYNLRRMRLDDVSVPRAEITAVPVDIALGDLVKVFRDSGFTRLPVYEGTLDTPIGLVHLKDLALIYGFNGGDKVIDLRPMLRPLLFAPPSMPIGVMLQKMPGMPPRATEDGGSGDDGLLAPADLLSDADELEAWSRANILLESVRADE